MTEAVEWSGADGDARLAAVVIERSRIIEYVHVDEAGRIAQVNGAFADHVGMAVEELIGRPISAFLGVSDSVLIERLIRGTVPVADALLLRFVTVAETSYTLRCTVLRESDGLRIAGEPELLASPSRPHNQSERYAG